MKAAAVELGLGVAEEAAAEEDAVAVPVAEAFVGATVATDAGGGDVVMDAAAVAFGCAGAQASADACRTTIAVSARRVTVFIMVMDSSPLIEKSPSLGKWRDDTAAERDATPEELRALGHPLRWRILRLTLDAPMTNKQIAERLGRDPGTVLHHVRELVSSGFLEAQDVRSGKRGALERPYRATGKTWRVRLAPNDAIAVPIIDAVREELLEAGDDATLATLRLGVRLKPDDLAALRAALSDLGAQFAARDDPQGEPIGILGVVHRRRS